MTSAHEGVVSVIIPAWNAARTVGETIRSALGQTHRPIEVVVVDDGSTDETAAVVSSFGAAVRYVRQKNSGAAAARNLGIERSSGEFVALLDADDLWLPDKLERQVRTLRADRSVGAVQCGTTYVDDGMNVLEVRTPPPRVSLWEVLNFRGVVALMSTLVIRRDCLAVAGVQRPEFEGKDEWEWTMRLARHCGIGSVPDPLVVHRVSPTSKYPVAAHIPPGLAVLEQVFADPTLPEDIRARRARVYASYYTMAAGGYFQAGRPWESVRWALKAAKSHPASLGYVAALPIRALRRVASRRRSRL